ncbi:hypothetical protein GCM10022384_54220 [Streptomyces marokkonensis]|uniref:Uncharacterized protein n=1 Tax=Streptomyces marokkonensis TaxID=324855 RepID=A0ABP7RPB2_9ACTN
MDQDSRNRDGVTPHATTLHDSDASWVSHLQDSDPVNPKQPTTSTNTLNPRCLTPLSQNERSQPGRQKGGVGAPGGSVTARVPTRRQGAGAGGT